MLETLEGASFRTTWKAEMAARQALHHVRHFTGMLGLSDGRGGQADDVIRPERQGGRETARPEGRYP